MINPVEIIIQSLGERRANMKYEENFFNISSDISGCEFGGFDNTEYLSKL